ncbi:uncharacterized protein LOC124175632 [Neodiprion fabricii]|uniref:uncharacterized protein LOC124175632 n=1 Tax=Neodiprion fabricii TaxID=2872261 RepID=UPI001ED8DDF0|nr:uncharacterized protein LOC124175632 [Neodiprion fabricii]
MCEKYGCRIFGCSESDVTRNFFSPDVINLYRRKSAGRISQSGNNRAVEWTYENRAPQISSTGFSTSVVPALRVRYLVQLEFQDKRSVVSALQVRYLVELVFRDKRSVVSALKVHYLVKLDIQDKRSVVPAIQVRYLIKLDLRLQALRGSCAPGPLPGETRLLREDEEDEAMEEDMRNKEDEVDEEDFSREPKFSSCQCANTISIIFKNFLIIILVKSVNKKIILILT